MMNSNEIELILIDNLIESKNYIKTGETIDYSNEFKNLIDMIKYTKLYKNNNNT
jgi:hypothetical protein